MTEQELRKKIANLDIEITGENDKFVAKKLGLAMAYIIIALIKEDSYVKLADDQSLPPNPYLDGTSTELGWQQGVEDMLKAGWRKVILEVKDETVQELDPIMMSETQARRLSGKINETLLDWHEFLEVNRCSLASLNFVTKKILAVIKDETDAISYSQGVLDGGEGYVKLADIVAAASFTVAIKGNIVEVDEHDWDKLMSVIFPEKDIEKLIARDRLK